MGGSCCESSGCCCCCCSFCWWRFFVDALRRLAIAACSLLSFCFSSPCFFSPSLLLNALDVLDVFEEPHPQPPGQRREREVHGRERKKRWFSFFLSLNSDGNKKKNSFAVVGLFTLSSRRRRRRRKKTLTKSDGPLALAPLGRWSWCPPKSAPLIQRSRQVDRGLERRRRGHLEGEMRVGRVEMLMASITAASVFFPL